MNIFQFVAYSVLASSIFKFNFPRLDFQIQDYGFRNGVNISMVYNISGQIAFLKTEAFIF